MKGTDVYFRGMPDGTMDRVTKLARGHAKRNGLAGHDADKRRVWLMHIVKQEEAMKHTRAVAAEPVVAAATPASCTKEGSRALAKYIGTSRETSTRYANGIKALAAYEAAGDEGLSLAALISKTGMTRMLAQRAREDLLRARVLDQRDDVARRVPVGRISAHSFIVLMMVRASDGVTIADVQGALLHAGVELSEAEALHVMEALQEGSLIHKASDGEWLFTAPFSFRPWAASEAKLRAACAYTFMNGKHPVILYRRALLWTAWYNKVVAKVVGVGGEARAKALVRAVMTQTGCTGQDAERARKDLRHAPRLGEMIQAKKTTAKAVKKVKGKR